MHCDNELIVSQSVVTLPPSEILTHLKWSNHIDRGQDGDEQICGE